jgi:hypothetical protein
MNTVGQPERATQNRVIALFHDELGYRYLSSFGDREVNSNMQNHSIAIRGASAGLFQGKPSAEISSLPASLDRCVSWRSRRLILGNDFRTSPTYCGPPPGPQRVASAHSDKLL